MSELKWHDALELLRASDVAQVQFLSAGGWIYMRLRNGAVQYEMDGTWRAWVNLDALMAGVWRRVTVSVSELPARWKKDFATWRACGPAPASAEVVTRASCGIELEQALADDELVSLKGVRGIDLALAYREATGGALVGTLVLDDILELLRKAVIR